MVRGMSKVVGIISRTDKEEALRLAAEVVRHLESKGTVPLLEPSLAAHLHLSHYSAPLEKMKADLMVTIGGDGTILRACLSMPKPEPPIIAVRAGSRGFLAEVSPEGALGAIDNYFRGDFRVERCSKIASFLDRGRLPDALNEVFVTSPSLAKMIHLRVFKNDKAVADCRADGVVVASQVGSTAYSLSGGGPILDPELNAFVLTPICPLTFMHPMVFPAECELKIELLSPEKAMVVIDGQYQEELRREEPYVKVRKSEHVTTFVRFESSFYDRLRRRLLFYREESVGE